MVKMTWRAQLENPAPKNHFVQTYKTEAELLVPVLHYVSAGLRRREAVLLVVTKSHGEAISMALTGFGFRLDALRSSGQLLLLDAGQTLPAFVEGDTVHRDKFFEVFEAPLRQALQRYPTVRAFGEMVDLLWMRGQLQAALALESLWTELLERHGFSLLCTYAIDNFATGEHSAPLKQICKAHTHYIPTSDYERLETSIFEAMDAVLGASQSAKLLSLVSSQNARHQATQMPLAQAVLLWLKDNMPALSDNVLLRSKSLYERDSAVPGYYA